MPRERADALSLERFVSDYVAKDLPVVVDGFRDLASPTLELASQRCGGSLGAAARSGEALRLSGSPRAAALATSCSALLDDLSVPRYAVSSAMTCVELNSSTTLHVEVFRTASAMGGV